MLFTDTTPFPIRDLSTHGFWILRDNHMVDGIVLHSSSSVAVRPLPCDFAIPPTRGEEYFFCCGANYFPKMVSARFLVPHALIAPGPSQSRDGTQVPSSQT